MLAEYDNFRKRTLNEKTAIYNNAVSDTVKELLPIADNIERALGQENASAEDMKKGVEMIEHQIQACFEKLGLEEMGKVGEAFDPNLHNAVAHIEDEALGENVIAAVYQKGYKPVSYTHLVQGQLLGQGLRGEGFPAVAQHPQEHLQLLLPRQL